MTSKKHNINQSENVNIQIEDESDEKKYFTTIPNIIYRMGLGAYAIAYYSILKSTAGERGKCFKSQATMAKEVGCSVRQIRYLNEILSQPFEILNGKPLIRITKSKRVDGARSTNIITLLDIWLENNSAIASNEEIPREPRGRKNIKKGNTEKKVPAPGAGEDRHHMPDPPAPRADKEEPYEEEPLSKKTTNPTLPPSNSVKGGGGLHKKEKKQKIYPCLEKLDLKMIDKTRLTKDFPEELVAKSVAYCTRPSFKIHTSFDGSIFHFCKYPEQIVISREEILAQKQKENDAKLEKQQARKFFAEKTREFLWPYCKQTLNDVYACPRTSHEYISFRNDRTEEKIYYSNDSFKNNLEHLLIKFALPLPKFLNQIP